MPDTEYSIGANVNRREKGVQHDALVNSYNTND